MTAIAESTTFRRRGFLLEPGDTLLLEPDPIRVMVNCGRFAELTGVQSDSLATSRLCALALPVGSIRDWPGVRPEAAWLPLLWLPPHLASPQCYVVDDEGLAHMVPMTQQGRPGVAQESEEEWMVRVSLELTASGFYDTETATFLDVMDYIHIDVDTNEARKRIKAWLGGRSDDDLDLFATGLELEGHLKSSGEPDWALNEVRANYWHLVNCAYAAGTESLIGTLDDLKETISSGRATTQKAQMIVATVCYAAAMWLEDLPLEANGSQDAGSESTWWLARASEAERFDGAMSAFVADHIEPARARLSDIYEATQPLVEEYLNSADDSA